MIRVTLFTPPLYCEQKWAISRFRCTYSLADPYVYRCTRFFSFRFSLHSVFQLTRPLQCDGVGSPIVYARTKLNRSVCSFVCCLDCLIYIIYVTRVRRWVTLHTYMYMYCISIGMYRPTLLQLELDRRLHHITSRLGLSSVCSHSSRGGGRRVVDHATRPPRGACLSRCAARCILHATMQPTYDKTVTTRKVKPANKVSPNRESE